MGRYGRLVVPVAATFFRTLNTMAHIKRLVIKHFLGVDELDISPGTITRIEGRNESGKSSILHGIKSALGYGETAELLRQGEEEGEIVLVLDDDKTIRRRFNKDGVDTTTVKDPERGTLSSPKTVLKKLADILSTNPLQFLLADDKTRAKYLIEAMNIRLSEKDSAVLSDAGIKTDTLPLVEDHLGWLNSARKEVFDKRTDVRRYRGEQAVLVMQMEDALPSEEVVDVSVVEKLQQRKAELQAKYDSTKAAIAYDYGVKLEALNNDRTKKLEQAQEYHQPEIQKVNEQITFAQKQLESAGRIKQQREMFEQAKAKEAELSQKVKTLDSQLDVIDAIKMQIMENLPIRGVEIREGDIFVDGIPWSDVNTARRIEVMFDLGSERMSELKVMTLDDAEHLDSESMAEIIKQAEQRGIQLFYATVEDTDLTIS